MRTEYSRNAVLDDQLAEGRQRQRQKPVNETNMDRGEGTDRRNIHSIISEVELVGQRRR